MNSIKVVGTSVVAHTFDPIIQETESDDSEFKVILIFTGVPEQSDYIDPASRKKRW